MATTRKSPAKGKDDEKDVAEVRGGDQDFETFEKPKAAVEAEKLASERAEEVAEQQKDAYLRGKTNVPEGHVETAYSIGEDGKPTGWVIAASDGAAITVVAGDGKSQVELVFNGQDASQLARVFGKVGSTL
jgi:hypothetical protein